MSVSVFVSALLCPSLLYLPPLSLDNDNDDDDERVMSSMLARHMFLPRSRAGSSSAPGGRVRKGRKVRNGSGGVRWDGE